MTTSHTQPPTSYGVSFSPRYATYLGLDYKVTYQSILEDLKVKNLRLNTYWSTVEPTEGKFDFEETDYLIDQAQKHQAKVLLVLGQKQPRWPECHIPDWARSLSKAQREEKILNLIKTVVSRYKDTPTIWGWQVENEPLFGFGENCYPADKQFLSQEVQLVKTLDSNHPVVLTDSGEWGWWITTSKLSDIQGISLYKKAFNNGLNFYMSYPFPSWYYNLKYQIAKIFAPKNQNLVNTELQAEPWFKVEVNETPISEQLSNFSIKDFQASIETAKGVKTNQTYLWGVEWWYYIQNQGHPEYLEKAKTIF